ncbi:MAG: protein kinase [Acidimicrobiales bacterium]|jgi:serine/threonine-protein kinase
MPPPTYATGHILVNRYQIQQLLGVGDTAEVYLAEDRSLQRSVVVKVLLPRLAGHEDVRRAFRERIIKAATLSHSHLARVFDGGQESGSIFMICEYLSGGSLEDVLASGRTLSVDDGARLGRDVGSALAYVHENGMVHGALSPSKLLLDDEGHVRVSDIALAGIGKEYRERVTLDDVRFLSPEQAIGDPANPRSDVYALALILYEAVTGITPFDGVTPEAVLRARINATLPMRPELGSLDMVLAQAAVPDPLQRLDAEQFASRLGAVVSDFAPLVIPPIGGEIPLLSQYRPSEPRNSIGFRPPSPDQITGATAVVSSLGRAGAPRHARPPDEWVTTGATSGRGRIGRDEFDDRDYARLPGSRRLVFLVAALVLLVVAIGGGIAWKVGLFTTDNSVPNFVGVNLGEYQNAAFTSNAGIVSLRTTMKSDGFVVAIKHAYSASVASGTIISQSPIYNTEAKSGAVITVTVSDGVQTVRLPALVGETCNTARPKLVRLHLVVQCPANKMIASNTVASGLIARVVNTHGRAITTAALHSTVVLERSSGPVASTTTTTLVTSTTTTVPTATLVAVPNVVGMNESQTDAAMKAADLYYSTTGPGASATNPTWTKVVSEDPVAGTMVKKLSSVLLHVTK